MQLCGIWNAWVLRDVHTEDDIRESFGRRYSSCPISNFDERYHLLQILQWSAWQKMVCEELEDTRQEICICARMLVVHSIRTHVIDPHAV